jgi:hypothetical protein
MDFRPDRSDGRKRTAGEDHWRSICPVRIRAAARRSVRGLAQFVYWKEDATMLELIRHLGWQKLAIEQLLPMGLALVIAELFFKFHSFTLECVAFIATWFALEYAWAELRLRLREARRH